MAWYRAGTVMVTNGSATVTGAGTDFVSFASSGDAFRGPDGRSYEIARVVSATELALAEPYLSGTGGGQSFAIQPTQSYIRDLALNAGTMLATFGAVRDGIGQGLIGDGSPAAPGIRFAADQDTGIFRLGQNLLAVAAGGMVGAYFGATGMTTPGTINAEASNGGGAHLFKRTGAQGEKVLEVFAATALYIAAGGAGSSAATAAVFATNTITGRSINAGGTINASGADYAEYMTKSSGCGTIAPGDVCGVDKDGRLTRTWADAVSFVVKSTEPAYVGGDNWAVGMTPRPEKAGEAQRAWDAALEAERAKVDRIAFCGQVPMNVTGGFAVGDYLIAAAAGAGIKAVAVPEADITFDQYRRRLGKVWAVRDERAWVDVQHG